MRADGFKVAACDLTADELKAAVAALGDAGVIAVPLDVTAEEQWASAVAEVLDTFGALRRWSTMPGYCTGPHWPMRPPPDSKTVGGSTLWARSWACGPACRRCVSAEGASIVNTCSTGAVRPFPNHAAYGSSKWALRGLTQIAAAELAPSGIRVNAVLPGAVETPMLDEKTQARLVATSVAGRIGKPMEIADAVAFLVSEQAAFITGSELVVDGGQSLQIG